MKTLKLSVIIALALIIGVSCNSSRKSVITTATNSINNSPRSGLFDAEWRKLLDDSKEAMKTVWLSRCNPINAFNDPGYAKIYNLISTQEDLAKLDVIPVEIFVIDSASFINWNPAAPVEPLLKLKKDEASSYIVKEKTFFYHVDFLYSNKQWKFKEYGPIFKQIADTISTLYFKKNIRVFSVFVETNTRPHGYRFIINAYQENGVLKSLEGGGRSQLFRDALIQLRKKNAW